MENNDEIIFESAAPEPGDKFWLEYGRKLMSGSFEAVTDAAKSLMTGIGVLQGIYLGIIGLADYIPEDMALGTKTLFFFPLLFWLAATYFLMGLLMTKKISINLDSPSDIKEKSAKLLISKQAALNKSFWLLTAGLLIALLLMIFRFNL